MGGRIELIKAFHECRNFGTAENRQQAERDVVRYYRSLTPEECRTLQGRMKCRTVAGIAAILAFAILASVGYRPAIAADNSEKPGIPSAGRLDRAPKDDRGSIDRPGVMYSRGEMAIRVWNPRQIKRLVQDIDLYRNGTQLSFDFSGTTDGELAALPRFPHVRYVHIFEEEAITDKSLSVFATFPELTELVLAHTGVSGAGFQYFATSKTKTDGSTPLQQLALADNRLTDDGLRELAKISTLHKLTIFQESGITTEGVLEHLPKLHKLTLLHLSFDESNALPTLVQGQLVAKMPHCEMFFGVRSGVRSRTRYKIGSGDPFALPEQEMDLEKKKPKSGDEKGSRE